MPTTVAGHPYWEEKDPAARKQQQIHFLKNLTMLGGLLIAAADTDGSPSLAWRRRRAARAARVGIGPAAQAVAGSARAAGDGLGHAAVTVGDVLAAELPRVMSAARVAGDRLSDAAQTAAGAAGDQLPGLAHAVSDSARTAADSARTAADKVVQAAQASRERARQYAAAPA